MRGKVCRKPYERQPCPGRLNAKKGRRTGLITDHGDLTVKLTADALRLQKHCVRTKEYFGTEEKSSGIGGRKSC